MKISRTFSSGWQSNIMLSALTVWLVISWANHVQAELRAGAAVIDITPTTFPVIVNGGMTSRTATKVHSKLHARSLALADDDTTVVIVVVDSCMMPRSLLDEAKMLASKRIGIPAERMMISATHTHTAGSSMGALGTPADENYVPLLRAKLADLIVASTAKLEPAKIGFGRSLAAEYTALRRWIRRPDRVEIDPFGNPTVRANMHAGRNWDDVTGESGPEDPQLSLIAVQSRKGVPIAVLANFSMHYFSGQTEISSDYFGRFCEGLEQRIAPNRPFIGMMSHGCSGDIWRRDYTRPDSWETLDAIDEYTQGLLDIAERTYQQVEYDDDVDLDMLERRLTLQYRVPDVQRLEWARRVVDAMGDRLPETRPEVYAAEQLILHERKQTEVVVQALRIGDIAIATTPNETYAVTGLKIKAASPLEQTMVIELANGGDGYIPPPEQHLFGGYNTWPARSAGLEVTAEPKIAETCIDLLERVCGRMRRDATLAKGPASVAIERLRPSCWYRLDEFTGPRAVDSSGHGRDAIYEPHVTYYLEGPDSARFCGIDQTNRAAMFVGGRLRTHLPAKAAAFSVSMWLWNGMPDDARSVSGWFLSRGRDHGLGASSEHLGIGGTVAYSGRIVFQFGDATEKIVAGRTLLPRWTWQHVVYCRDADTVRVYLNGQLEIETSVRNGTAGIDQLFVGGRSDNTHNWEGRIDEVAIFDRALTYQEVSSLWQD